MGSVLLALLVTTPSRLRFRPPTIFIPNSTSNRPLPPFLGFPTGSRPGSWLPPGQTGSFLVVHWISAPLFGLTAVRLRIHGWLVITRGSRRGRFTV